MEGRLRQRVVMTVLVMTAVNVNGESLIYVGGGKETWRPNVNFSDWSAHQHFYVSDWLYFGFDTMLYNVLEVNKTSYETCNEANFIKNVTRGGRDVFHLTQVKTYYFISGRGYCYGGMKVAINVEDIPLSPAPAPALDENASPPKFRAQNTICILLIIIRALAWPFI